MRKNGKRIAALVLSGALIFTGNVSAEVIGQTDETGQSAGGSGAEGNSQIQKAVRLSETGGSAPMDRPAKDGGSVQTGRSAEKSRTEETNQTHTAIRPSESDDLVSMGQSAESGETEGAGQLSEMGGSEGSGQPSEGSGAEGAGQPSEGGGAEGSGQMSEASGTEGAGQPSETGGVEGSGQPSGMGGAEGSSQSSGMGGAEGSGQSSGMGGAEGSGQSSGMGGAEGFGQSSEMGVTEGVSQTQEAGQPTKPDGADKTGQEGETNGTEESSQNSSVSQDGTVDEEHSENQRNQVQRIEEDNKKEEIFQVILPADTGHIFDFIMDPQELISQTEAAAYNGSTFEEGATLFFKRSDGESEEDYSSFSDAVIIVNAGTVAVNVSLTAYISPESIRGITMSEDPDFTDDENPSLYLALTDGEETVPIDSEYGASMDTWIEGVKDGDTAVFSFRLTGAVNKNGDWSEITDIAPEVTVTWKVTADEEEVWDGEAGKEDGSQKSGNLPEAGSSEKDTGEARNSQESESMNEDE